MENNSAPKKRRWRLNLFDVIVICVIIIAGIAFTLVTRASRGTGISVSSGTAATVRYTVELTGMHADAAYLVEPGHVLTDRVEKRTLGTVVAVEVIPYENSTKNILDGNWYNNIVPGRMTAVVLLESAASETDSAIVVDGGFLVRAGLPVSANGPGYVGSGYIISVVRDGE